MPDDRRRRPFNVRFEAEEYTALENLAQRVGMSMNMLLRQLTRHATGLPTLSAHPIAFPPEKPAPPNPE